MALHVFSDGEAAETLSGVLCHDPLRHRLNIICSNYRYKSSAVLLNSNRVGHLTEQSFCAPLLYAILVVCPEAQGCRDRAERDKETKESARVEQIRILLVHFFNWTKRPLPPCSCNCNFYADSESSTNMCVEAS